jgi:hypothetical protein
MFYWILLPFFGTLRLMINKLHSFLDTMSKIMENDPKDQKTYDLGSFLDLNESSHLLSLALSKLFNPDQPYTPFSIASLKVNENVLTIESCIDSKYELGSNDCFYLPNDKSFYYQIQSSIDKKTKIKKISFTHDTGSSFVELPITTATFKVSKIKSYNKENSDIGFLDYSNQGDFKSLDWKIQESLAGTLGINLNKKDFWTNEGKKTIFNTWVAINKAQDQAKTA